MTNRFWFYLSVSAALAVAVCLFVWLRGPAGLRVDTFETAPMTLAATLLLTLAFLYAFARLLLRSTGSDRAMGLLGLYAVLLWLPFIAYFSSSPRHAAAICLLTAALLEILDLDLSHANAARSGVFTGLACVAEPKCAVLASALLPIVAAVAWPRWRLPLRFAVAAAVPWFLLTRLLDFGPPLGELFPVREGAVLSSPAWWVSTLAKHARGARSSLEGDFLSPYAAFATAGLVVATVRRMGPSRRSIAAAAWLFAIAALATAVLDDSATAFFRSAEYLLLILLANTGLAALAAMNPLHAGRRRMMPAGALFLLPPVIGWLRLLV